jgi:hypothetical protein
VLLVDHDGAKVAQRREDRRSRSHGDTFATVAKRKPLIVSLAVAQRAVQHGNLVAEHRAEAIDRLRRQRNLWHEHDRGLPLLQHDAPQQLDIDERLAASRDAAE